MECPKCNRQLENGNGRVKGQIRIEFDGILAEDEKKLKLEEYAQNLWNETVIQCCSCGDNIPIEEIEDKNPSVEIEWV